MSDEIIDFYKKAKEPEEPQKSIEEQKETPVPEIPKPDEPFDRFLLELAEKLQKEKVITEKQQETFVEQIKEPVSTDPNENDPFKKFIGSFANILKQDELVTREENIKEATISFINKLKEQPDEPFIIKDEPVIKTKKQKYLPPKIAKKVQNLPQPNKQEKPLVAEQTDELVKEEPKNNENQYVKELKTADKVNKKIPEKIKSVSDIKSIVEKQVAEILSRYPNLGFTGGGGGTNAVQYAKGGTMDGDLNVTGKFLSGGVDLSTLIGSGGSGATDRLVASTETLILCSDGTMSFPNNFISAPDGEVLNIQSETISPSSFARISLTPYAFFAYDNEGNSISFDIVDNTIELITQDQYSWKFNNQGKLVGPSNTLAVSGNVDVTNKFLSGGVDLADIFITSAEESQTLAYDTQTELLSITRGNSVSLSSLSDKTYADTNFLKLSGGIISGNLTVQGNISALGSATFANTIFTTTSALSVVNTGPGPALYVYQAAGPYDVASFYDGDGIEVLHVGNAGPGSFGKVGINESVPNKELTVRGSISATEIIYAPSILVNLSEPDPLSPNNKLQASSLTVLGTDPVGGQPTTTILKGGAFFGAADGTRGIMVERQTALGDAIYFTGLDDQISEYNNILFTTGYYPQFWLEKDTGNVGIGTNTPTSTLDVNGTITTTSDGNSVQWNETYTTVQTNSATWISPTRQFDYVVQDSISYNYCGTAPQGSLTSNSTWTIKRLLFTSAGTLLSAGIVYNSIWDNRYSYSY